MREHPPARALLALALAVFGWGWGCGQPAGGGSDGGDAAMNACASPIGAPEATLCRDGWCWDHPRPEGAPLRAVSATAADDAWAVAGEFAGVPILHFDGTSWSAVSSGTGAPLDGVFAIARDDAWAVGAGGATVRWDCRAWTAVASGTTADLHAVWASGASDAWAVGDGGTVLHFDGGAWSPASSATPASLRAVWGSGVDDVWAVGDGATVLHFDGRAWTSIAVPRTPLPVDLRGVWGAGPKDVWLVGTGSSPRGAFYHFDGSTWRVATTTGGVRAIGGSDSSHAWAVGEGGRTWRLDATGTWSLGAGANAASPGLDGVAVDPSAARAGAAWSVGVGGVISHFDGNAWNTVRGSPPLTATRLFGTGPADIWAGGFGAAGSSLAHFDGGAWSVVDASGIAFLSSLWGSGPRDVWAAGGDTLYHFDGSAWTPSLHASASGGAIATFAALWGTGPSDAWAIDNTRVYHFDGRAWTLQSDRSADGFLRGLWASGPGDVWIVGLRADGSAPLLLHGDGVGWTAIASPVTSADIGGAPPLVDVRGSAADDVWALGSPSTTDDFLLHYDGHAWSRVSIPSTTASHLALTGRGDVWLLGDAIAFRGGSSGFSGGFSPVAALGAQLLDVYQADAQHRFAAAAGDDAFGFLLRAAP